MKVYLSNIRSAWSFDRQEALLDESIPGWRSNPIYRDDLSAAKRREHVPEHLKERVDLTRPTGRRTGEDVHVATLSIMAWTLPDFLRVLVALQERRATLHAHAENIHLPPSASLARITEVGDEFLKATRRGQTEGGRAKGAKIAAKRRMDAAQAGCAAIKERWGMPSEMWPTNVLLDEAQVSRPTAIQYLGKRRDAQRLYEVSQAQAARNRARRKQR